MRQNRVLIWINKHIQSKVTEFFLTDWFAQTVMDVRRAYRLIDRAWRPRDARSHTRPVFVDKNDDNGSASAFPFQHACLI